METRSAKMAAVLAFLYVLQEVDFTDSINSIYILRGAFQWNPFITSLTCHNVMANWGNLNFAATFMELARKYRTTFSLISLVLFISVPNWRYL